MNLMTKKLLAKYVKYIEIIGYVFVLLFIAGLIALSFIKAEDEFVNLNGNYEIAVFLPEFAQPHCIVSVQADSFATVAPGIPLFEITEDAAFCTEQTILKDLRKQAKLARNNSRPELARQLETIIHQHAQKAQAPAHTRLINAKIPGEFILLDSAPGNNKVGGVFDFRHSSIRVTAFPPDGRLKKKLALNQTGTANLAAASLSLPVKLVELSESEAVFKIDSLKIPDKSQLAAALAKLENDKQLKAHIAVLVGWKSWMRLIWR